MAAAVGRSEIANSVTTTAGTLTNNVHNNFTLNDWALFPMIHHALDLADISLAGNTNDVGSASAPRFAIKNENFRVTFT